MYTIPRWEYYMEWEAEYINNNKNNKIIKSSTFFLYLVLSEKQFMFMRYTQSYRVTTHI